MPKYSVKEALGMDPVMGMDWRAKPNVYSQPEVLNMEMQEARARGDIQNAGYLKNEMKAGKVQETGKPKPRFSVAEAFSDAQQAQQSAQQPDGIDFSLNADKVKAVGQGLKDAAGALVRSGTGLVSNAMRPLDTLTGGDHKERMALVDGRLKGKGYDTESATFQGVKLGADVLATLPVGGAFGKVATKAGLPALGTALSTGGFRTGLPAATTLTGKAGQMALRSVAGAAVGGASTALIDPSSAGTGAMIGGALPPGLKLAGEAGKLVKLGAGGIVKHGLGMTTGTGAESVSAAYNAGKNKSGAFLDNMRGNVPFDDVVDDAKGALGKMREARAADYRSGMVDISNDKAVIPFQPIDDAVRKIGQMGSYKGQRINKNAAGTVDDLMATIDNWRGLDPAEYHTPEGLDALKQAIGDIRDTTQFGTAARRATDEVYNAVKNQITAQAPTYAKVMKDYSEASILLKEIESGLSVGPNKSRDAAVRKLQSILRNNAQTNYGNRLNLARQLEEKGGADLMPSLAGQSMNAVMPRGITGAIQKGGALLTAAGTGGASIVPTLLAAPFTSPRLVGEALYGVGRMNGAAGNVLNFGKQGLNRLASQHPGLLDLENALYKGVPVMATSATQKARQ